MKNKYFGRSLLIGFRIRIRPIRIRIQPKSQCGSGFRVLIECRGFTLIRIQAFPASPVPITNFFGDITPYQHIDLFNLFYNSAGRINAWSSNKTKIARAYIHKNSRPGNPIRMSCTDEIQETNWMMIHAGPNDPKHCSTRTFIWIRTKISGWIWNRIKRMGNRNTVV
jgi:hypothetical protein